MRPATKSTCLLPRMIVGGLLLLVAMSANLNAAADDSTQVAAVLRFDSTFIEQAAVNQDKLSAYLADPELNYTMRSVESTNFLTILLAPIFRALREFMIRPYYQPVRSILYYLMIGAVLVVVIYVLRKSRFSKAWRQQEKESLDIGTVEEDIHKVDLATLLEQATQQKEYRRAVRLGFLQVLRKMSDSKVINWRQEKTNRDYRQEVSDRSYAHEFAELIRLYEYIWYGNFPVDATTFGDIRHQMQQLQDKISGQA